MIFSQNGGELNEAVKQAFTRWDPNGRWKGTESELFECHVLVAICSLVCNNNVSPMGNVFCPWCMCQKKTIHGVTDENKIQDGDIIHSISKFYAMSPNLLLVSYICLLKVYIFVDILSLLA